MKYAVIVLSAAALAACDGLSVAQKKPDVRSVPVAAQKVDATAVDPRQEADKLLAARVKAALEQAEKALAENIDVVADAGVVTLWGTASAPAESARLGKVAIQVDGVKSVDNKIVVVKGS